MQTSFRLKIGLFLSGVLLVVFAIQSVVPRFLTSFVSLFDSRTTSSCTTRCGDTHNLPLPSDPLVINFDPIAETVATEPDPLLLRTGFDSTVVAPPYPFIFIFLMVASVLAARLLHQSHPTDPLPTAAVNAKSCRGASLSAP